MRSIAAAVLACLLAGEVSAATIDTNGSWDGSVNNTWNGSGQTLTVDLVESRLDSIGFYFDEAANGRDFSFEIRDSGIGGPTLFSLPSVQILTGFNLFVTNLNLTPGSTIYALINYLGYNGPSAHFSYLGGYDGGQSLFLLNGWDESFTNLDHRFVANFSSPQVVPLPAGAMLLLTGLAGLILLRKGQSSVAA